MTRYSFFLLVFFIASTYAQESVEPASNQEGDLNTVKQNTVENSYNKNYNGQGAGSQIPVASSIAPSLMSNGPDTCLQSVSTGVQLVGFGVSRGKYVRDPDCNLRRYSTILNSLGMKLGALSVLCSQKQIFVSLLMASTPCPITYRGKIAVGRRAYLLIKKNPRLYIEDYDDRAEYYNTILGVGFTDNETGETDNRTISARFRSSLRTDSSTKPSN